MFVSRLSEIAHGRKWTHPRRKYIYIYIYLTGSREGLRPAPLQKRTRVRCVGKKQCKRRDAQSGDD